MKNNILMLVLAVLSLQAMTVAQVRIPRPSQAATVTQTIGITDITIKYSRPGVKGRAIWGGLVPYDTVWRTGANEATTISVSDTVMIQGHALPPGTYMLATIPGKTSWTIVFNNDADLWGAFSYKKEHDLFRITVTPEQGEHQEWMRFSFEDINETSARVVLAWEKSRISFMIEASTVQLTLAKGRNTVNWDQPMQLANYAVQKGANLVEAMKWIDVSLMFEENYSNLRVKAQLLEKVGKKKDAIAMMERAIAIGKAQKNRPFDFAEMQKKLAEWKGN